MKKIYLATPYSHKDREMMTRRYEFITRVTSNLMQDDNVVFSPITHSHSLAEQEDIPTDWDFWKNQDLPFIRWCDELRVLKTPGFQSSTGVQAEIEYAEDQDKRIKFEDPLDHMDVVSISGKKRSGKDTMADYLVEKYDYEKYALAGPIKDAAQSIFGLTDEQIDGSRKEDRDPLWDRSPREIMQEFGTNVFRDWMGDDVWIRSLERRLRTELPLRAVVSDVRFPNEVKWGLQVGRAYRIDASERLDHNDTHESETALDNFSDSHYDDVIDNNGEIEEFYNRIDNLNSHTDAV